MSKQDKRGLYPFWNDWINHPMTKQFFSDLREERMRLLEVAESQACSSANNTTNILTKSQMLKKVIAYENSAEIES